MTEGNKDHIANNPLTNNTELASNISDLKLELLQYQLWDKFKGKLWTLLIGAITITSILGALGVKNYIDSKLEKQISNTQDSINKYKLLLVTQSSEIVLKTKMLSYLSYRWQMDNQTFYQLVELCKHDLDSTFGRNRNMDEVFNDIQNKQLNEKAYAKVVIFFTDILNGKAGIGSYKNIRIDTLTLKQDDEFENITRLRFQNLHVLITMYPHLITLERVMQHCIKSIFDEDFVNVNQKNDFFRIYEKNIGEFYTNEFVEYHSYWKSNNNSKFSWTCLPLNGNDAMKMINGRLFHFN
ncbi:MAG: hypothetical protein BGO69_17155 [Bacteroidetes bacterium 46-16]|nr:MAG: hypothetical protein BGO69_17155 [Bacteroidetes bacterium 46-16]